MTTMTTKQTDAAGFDLRDNYVASFWADGPSRQYPDFLDSVGDLHVYLGKVDGVAQYDFTTVFRGRTVTDENADSIRQTKREHHSGLMVPNASVGRSRERAEQSYGPLVNRERDTASTVEDTAADRAPTAADMGRARTAEDELAILRVERDAAEARATAAEHNASRTQQTHEAFKRRVREHAIEVAQRQGWCDQGLNESLEELGLPGYHREWTMTLTVTVTVSGADSEDEAVRWAERAISSTDGDVDISNTDVLVDSIEQVED
jgi:hypothetical protein